MTIPDPSFGEMMRRARRSGRVRVTLGDLAEHLGLSVSYLSDIENGRRRPLEAVQIIRAANLLGADPAPLLRAAVLARDNSIKLQSDDPMKQDLLLGLARNLERLDHNQIRRLQRILNDDDGGDE